MPNGKGQMMELLQGLGHSPDKVTYVSVESGGLFTSTATVSLPDGVVVTATGTARAKVDAEGNAAEEAIAVVGRTHPEFLVNWSDIRVRAQAGDALIKLAVYAAPGAQTAEQRTGTLQTIETDAHHCLVYQALRDAGDPRASWFGPALGRDKMAMLVEAWLWDDFRHRILAPGSGDALSAMLASLSLSTQNHR